jgi:hypothetical protein
MSKTNSQGYDPRPIFDIRLVPLLSRFKRRKAMHWANFKAAFPDLLIAATFLYAIITFRSIKPAFRSNMEGTVILELIVLICFPVIFRVFAVERKAEFKTTRLLRFMTGWISFFNVFFMTSIMMTLAYFSSMEKGRSWIPLTLFILIGTKVYSIFFSGEKKVKAMAFCARLTARLVGGLFCGIFTYFFAAVALGLLLTPDLLSELSMLLVGYVYFTILGLYSIYKQDLLYILGAPFPHEGETDEEMICEIWYPRLEVPLDKYEIPKDADLYLERKPTKDDKRREKSWFVPILLLALLLPTICLLPLRGKFIEYGERNRTEIRKNKVTWEKRFNWGAGIVFGTSMLWILFVVTMTLAREKVMEKKQSK